MPVRQTDGTGEPRNRAAYPDPVPERARPAGSPPPVRRAHRAGASEPARGAAAGPGSGRGGGPERGQDDRPARSGAGCRSGSKTTAPASRSARSLGRTAGAEPYRRARRAGARLLADAQNGGQGLAAGGALGHDRGAGDGAVGDGAGAAGGLLIFDPLTTVERRPGGRYAGSCVPPTAKPARQGAGREGPSPGLCPLFRVTSCILHRWRRPPARILLPQPASFPVRQPALLRFRSVDKMSASRGQNGLSEAQRPDGGGDSGARRRTANE